MSAKTLTFRGGRGPLIVFLVGLVAILLGGVAIRQVGAVTAAPSSAVAAVVSDLHFVALLLLTAVVLRLEGVRPAALGLSGWHLGAAAAAFAVVWVLLNGIGIGLAVAAGNAWGLGVLADKLAPWAGITGVLIVFAGFVEEVAMRGYLQTKLIAVRGDRSRADLALAILGASLVFALAHLPGALLAGQSPGAILFGLVLLTASGVTFGVIYEATHNLYFVTLLHASGNTWILAVDGLRWSGWPFALFLMGILVAYVGVTVGYRRWARGTTLSPVVHRQPADAPG